MEVSQTLPKRVPIIHDNMRTIIDEAQLSKINPQEADEQYLTSKLPGVSIHIMAAL